MTLNLTKYALLLLLLLTLSIPLTAQDSRTRRKTGLTDSLRQASYDTLKLRLLLNAGHVWKDHFQNKRELDTALIFANNALTISLKFRDLSKTGDCLDLKSQIYDHQGKAAEARDFEKQAIGFFLKDNNLNREGDAYRQLGRYYGYEKEKDLLERIRCDNIALALFVKTNNKAKQANTLQELGNLHSLHNEMPVAIATLKKALVLYKQVNYKDVQGIYNLLCECYNQIGDGKQAINYGLQAIKVAEALQDSSAQLCAIYNHVGQAYQGIGQSEKAMLYYNLGFASAKKIHDMPSVFVIAINLSNILMSQNKSAETIQVLSKIGPAPDVEMRTLLYSTLLRAYVNIGKSDAMPDRYYKLLSAQIPLLDKSSFVKENTYSNLIAYHFYKKNYKETWSSLNIFDSLVNNHNTRRSMVLVQRWKFRLDSVRGDYLSAIKHLQRAGILGDSLLNEGKSKSIAQLEVQYESEKKEREIQLRNQRIDLLTKQGQLQTAGLQKAQLIRNVTVIGTVMLVILLLVSYNRYQIKQRSNVQLHIQQELINKKNFSLERLVSDKDVLLQEKEWLLKEIHHRVKNNLQIVISLLNSQSSYLDNDAAIAAIRESQHRMHSISLIHQKLYQSDNLARIDMVDYIVELTDYLQHSFAGEKAIEIDLQIEPISLDVAQAVPVGLILNEAVTNAIKYAFSPGKAGRITISLDEPDEHSVLLTIADNGPGLPDNFDTDACNSLGLSLMKGLSRQLHGEFSVSNSNGLTLRLRIPTKIPATAESYIAI